MNPIDTADRRHEDEFPDDAVERAVYPIGYGDVTRSNHK